MLKRDDSRPLISIVVPMYNEEGSIPAFFAAIEPVLEQISHDYEIICVNDGSRDSTFGILQAYAAADSRVRILDLSRNFGKEAALSAGLDFSTGDTVIPMDADLQDPPELIPRMITLWRNGSDVVLAIRHDRSSDQPMKRIPARWFYRLMSRISDIHIPENAGDFRLMDRQVVDALARMPERTRFMKGIFAWLGFNTAQISFARPKRQEGSAKLSFRSLFKLAMDGIVSFTTLPLRIWTVLGFFLSLLAGFFMIGLVIRTMILGRDVPGYASLMTVLLFFNGIILINLGILGEYVARIYTEVKHRPLYLVRETVNLGQANEIKPSKRQDYA